MNSNKIGIIGSRRRNEPEDKEQIRKALIPFLKDKPIIVSGGCPKGGDRFAEELAKEYGLEIIIHYPDKSKLLENAQRWDYAKICYERNDLIARDSDILIACVAETPGGTDHTIRCFKMHYKKKHLILLTKENEYAIV